MALRHEADFPPDRIAIFWNRKDALLFFRTLLRRPSIKAKRAPFFHFFVSRTGSIGIGAGMILLSLHANRASERAAAKFAVPYYKHQA